MDATITAPSPFALLELPDGRWCVARTAAPAAAGSAQSPVGFYATRDDAELAILRADPSGYERAPLSHFAPWLRNS